MPGRQKCCYIQPLCCVLVWAALALVWVSVRPGVTHEIKQSSVHNHYNNHIFQRWQIGLNVATKSYNKDLQQLQISLLGMAGENTAKAAKLSHCPRTVQCMVELTPPHIALFLDNEHNNKGDNLFSMVYRRNRVHFSFGVGRQYPIWQLHVGWRMTLCVN